MKEKKKKVNLVFIFAMILIAVIFIFIIFNLISYNKNENKVDLGQNTVTNTQNEVNPNLSTDIEALSKLEEYDRMKYYFNKYLFYIENQEYDKAYSLLYSDFKQQYFKTIEEYKKYVSDKYPVVNSVDFADYNKLGKYHILTIKFSDILNATDSNVPTFEQKFIIIENGLNDFTLSFQAE